ncbi:hypothetical protein PHLGIDRAFT_100535 [Phlebiopsis gigantea 11061_1 CR5-6]|uniref:BTB domain-containing protein n=1 Tax=Phlebiopsis gigantea (strain 11061_1 CR5-6) TaxID=745531 RepID=A0A0C3PTQ3_PHLG1|nr:hypothetical protein PHLGIDRAFT_100535 [Phlebiopsis gigantea 11061_1 CR5-6]
MQSEDAEVAAVAAAAEDEKPAPVFHELFNSPDADSVLGSKDGVLFRVHSFVLKTTSGWFRAMFSLPQKSQTPDDPAVIAYLDEDAATLEALLRCVCGLPIPRLDSYDTIEALLFAAEKYDMPGPPSIVRAMVSTPTLLADPLRLFVLACRYGWEDVVQLASAQTLSLSIYDKKYTASLEKLSSRSLLKLGALHRGRRDALEARLNEPPFVPDHGDSSCSHCGASVDYHTWRALKSKIFKEMDARPLGDMVVEPGMTLWDEAQSCWSAKCSNCHRVLYDKMETQRVIRECMQQLPTTLDAMASHEMEKLALVHIG